MIHLDKSDEPEFQLTSTSPSFNLESSTVEIKLESVGEKGEKGDKGDKGEAGETPDMSIYATNASVDEKIAAIPVPEIDTTELDNRINNKVDKSGDTMTGSLVVEHSKPESNIYTYSDKKTDYNSFNFKMEANHDTARVFGSGIRGEKNARFSFDAKGRLSWGDGTANRGFGVLDIDYTNRRLVASRMSTAHTPSDQYDMTNKKYVDEKMAAIPAGPMGPAGPQGEKGEPFKYSDFTPEQLLALKGDKGDKGDAGPQGEAGPAGSQGVKGDTGPAGETGPAGPQGLKGDTGPQGPVGPAGPQGPQGDAGTTDYNLLTNKPDLSTYATRQYVDTKVASIPAGGGGGGSAVQDTGWINIPVPAGVATQSGMQPRIRRIGNVVYVNITDLKFSTANEILLLNRNQLEGFKSIGRDTAPLWYETTIVGAVYAKYMGLGIQAPVGDWRYGTLSYITNDAFPTKRSF